jgi:hypothetical protein
MKVLPIWQYSADRNRYGWYGALRATLLVAVSERDAETRSSARAGDK